MGLQQCQSWVRACAYRLIAAYLLFVGAAAGIVDVGVSVPS